MSVTTTADEARDAAKQNINEAIKHLSAIVVEQVWGHDDYTEDYQAKLRDAFRELLTLRDRL